MNLSFLQYFKDTYELSSVSKAAQLRGVSNTAISKGIRALELSLGVELIHHKKNQLKFTNKADLIYERAKDILFKVGELTNQSESQEVIKIGIIHSLATGVFAQTITDLSITKNIEIIVSNPTETKNLLSRYLIDVGVTIKRKEKNIDPDNIIYDGKFELFQSVDTKNIEKIIYVTPKWPEVIEFYNESTELLLKGYKLCVIDSWDVIYSLLKKGRGYGLLPNHFKVRNKKIKKARISKFSYPYSIVIDKQNSFFDLEVLERIKNTL
jgi:hypothetical protein